MEVLRENTAKYIIVTMVFVLLTFGVDHYILGDTLNALVGCVIGIAPTFFMMLRDVMYEADARR